MSAGGFFRRMMRAKPRMTFTQYTYIKIAQAELARMKAEKEKSK